MLSAFKFFTVFIINFIIIFFITGCNQPVGNNDITADVPDTLSAIISDTPVIKIKVSEQYPEIYAFIKALIKDHQLDTGYGLFIEPELACDLSQNDITFLKTILIKKEKKIKPPEIIQDTSQHLDSNLHINFNKWQLLETPISITIEPERGLTKQDINYMLAKKPNPLKFRWDIEELGFDTSNHQNFYSLSIPLFSIDHKTAVIMIEDLCPGLCGTGNTYIYKRKNNVWKTETSSFGWIH